MLRKVGDEDSNEEESSIPSAEASNTKQRIDEVPAVRIDSLPLKTYIDTTKL